MLDRRNLRITFKAGTYPKRKTKANTPREHIWDFWKDKICENLDRNHKNETKFQLTGKKLYYWLRLQK